MKRKPNGCLVFAGFFLLADSRGRKSGKPYRLAADDHCAQGNCAIVELPVSGGFGDYWVPDEEGGFDHFGPILTESGMERQMNLFETRMASLGPIGVSTWWGPGREPAHTPGEPTVRCWFVA